MKELLDLCCGLGGWAAGFVAEGWKVTGVDIADFSAVYPGTFIQADLLTWEGWRELHPDLVIASTPCQEFTRQGFPWLKKKNPPAPDLRLWYRAEFIARALGAPADPGECPFCPEISRPIQGQLRRLPSLGRCAGADPATVWPQNVSPAQ